MWLENQFIYFRALFVAKFWWHIFAAGRMNWNFLVTRFMMNIIMIDLIWSNIKIIKILMSGTSFKKYSCWFALQRMPLSHHLIHTFSYSISIVNSISSNFIVLLMIYIYLLSHDAIFFLYFIFVIFFLIIYSNFSKLMLLVWVYKCLTKMLCE